MNVHFIAIGGSAMHNLALALHNKGYQVTGSDDTIFEPSKSRLKAKGLLPEVFGWYPDKISTTLTASDTNRLGVFYKNRIRRITPREAAKIQGFPNNFILNPNDNIAYSQLGNAVSVPVVRCIVADVFKNNNL